MYRTRSPRIVGAGTEEYRRVLSASLAVVGVIAVALMIFRPEYARGYLLVALPASMGALLIGRHCCRRALLWQRRRGRCVVAVLAVGDERSVRSLVQSLSRGWWYGYEVVGVCLTGHAAGGTIDVPGVGPLPVLGDENGVDQAISHDRRRRGRADRHRASGAGGHPRTVVASCTLSTSTWWCRRACSTSPARG